MSEMEVIGWAFALVMGVTAWIVATRKYRNHIVWALAAFLFFPVILILLALPPKDPTPQMWVAVSPQTAPTRSSMAISVVCLAAVAYGVVMLFTV